MEEPYRQWRPLTDEHCNMLREKMQDRGFGIQLAATVLWGRILDYGLGLCEKASSRSASCSHEGSPTLATLRKPAATKGKSLADSRSTWSRFLPSFWDSNTPRSSNSMIALWIGFTSFESSARFCNFSIQRTWICDISSMSSAFSIAKFMSRVVKYTAVSVT